LAALHIGRFEASTERAAAVFVQAPGGDRPVTRATTPEVPARSGSRHKTKSSWCGVGNEIAFEASRVRLADGAPILNWTDVSSGAWMLASNGTKVVLRGIRLEGRGAGIPFSGIEMIANARTRQPSCAAARRHMPASMCSAAILVALALTLLSCDSGSYGVVTHRARDGRPDQWVTRINKDEYQISIDTNGDGKPDVIKTVRDNEIVEIQSDRNFDGKVDLVQRYARGKIVREIRDDDFNGVPETVKTFRPDGTLAIVERDPEGRGAISVVEYYDNRGHLTRREAQSK